MEAAETGSGKPGEEEGPVPATAEEMALSAQAALRLWRDGEMQNFSAGENNVRATWSN